MTDNPLVEAVDREGTPGPYVIVNGTVIGSLAPVPHGVEIYEWYDQSQVDGPDYRFVAETETGTEEGRANARKILAALRAIEDAGWKVVKKEDRG